MDRAPQSSGRDLDIQFADATVQCEPLPEDEFVARVPDAMRERLLNEDEVRQMGGSRAPADCHVTGHLRAQSTLATCSAPET